MIELPRSRPPSDLIASKAVYEAIRHFEGCVLYAYDDKEPRYPKTRITAANAHLVKGKLTIGFGRAVGVKPGDTCTMQEAEEWLRVDIEKHAQIVRDQIRIPLTQPWFDSLTDVAYNLGYIPRSLLACINGGKTDKGVMMEPGSFSDALKQLPRNCRWGGVPNQELYRRRLVDACLALGLPWQGACSKNLVTLAVIGADIDPVETTSLEDTILRARQDIPIQSPPSTIDAMKRDWPMPLDKLDIPAPKPEASVTFIDDDPQEDLILTREVPPETRQEPRGSVSEVGGSVAAQEPEASARPDQPAEAVRPVPGEVASPLGPDPAKSIQESAPSVSVPVESGVAEERPSPSNSSPVSPPVAAAPKALPKDPPPVIAGVDGAKPKSPLTVDPRSVPYRIDPNAGLAPMEETGRWKASLAQNGGMVFIRIARYGLFGVTGKNAADFLEGDAVLMQAFLMYVGVACVALYGFGRKSYGDWCRRRAEERASQAMW